MLDGISNFEWKRVENLVNCQQLLFTGIEWHSKFRSNLCKNYGEKHHRAFVNVVEGSEIYNFAFYSVHFSCKIGRKSQVNIATRNNPRGWNVPPRSSTPRRAVHAVHRCTRTPRWARDPHSVRHTPWDAPPRHVELPHSSPGPCRRFTRRSVDVRMSRAHAKARRRTHDVNAGVGFAMKRAPCIPHLPI
jgi:hypothetical protein